MYLPTRIAGARPPNGSQPVVGARARRCSDLFAASEPGRRRLAGGAFVLGVGAAAAWLGALAVATTSAGADAVASPAAIGAPSATNASVTVDRMLFTALFVPALDPDAETLQWVDPRGLVGCGPGTAVRVDGEPLRPAAAVPDQPFELLWAARRCRPFGGNGPVLDGTIRFRVTREDWGFSAHLTPIDRALLADGEGSVVIAPRATSTPLTVDPGFDIGDWSELPASSRILGDTTR